MTIHHILFDLGQVLVPFDWDRALQRILPHLSPRMADLLNGDKKAFIELFHEPATELEKGHMDFLEFTEIVSDILGVRLVPEEFRRIWCDIFQPDREMIALGGFLSTHYGTWLVSNTSEAHYRWIVEKFPEVSFYRDAALSFELGVMKPAREYYEQALERFDIDPATAVFIDDLEANVEGAVRSGMIGIVFQGRRELVRQLRDLQVIVPEAQEDWQ